MLTRFDNQILALLHKNHENMNSHKSVRFSPSVFLLLQKKKNLNSTNADNHMVKLYNQGYMYVTTRYSYLAKMAFNFKKSYNLLYEQGPSTLPSLPGTSTVTSIALPDVEMLEK